MAQNAEVAPAPTCPQPASAVGTHGEQSLECLGESICTAGAPGVL